MKLGKSPEIDGLAAEHTVYSHNNNVILFAVNDKCYLSLLFTCMINPGYAPDAIIKTSIISIWKNKNGDASAETTTGR